MLIPYITTFGFLLIYAIFISIKYWRMQKRGSLMDREFRKESYEADVIFQNMTAYLILIDWDFIIRKTNYYSLNCISEDDSVKRVGDLLRCRNAIESGDCGTHKHCELCGIRAIITHAFIKGENFNRFESSMDILSPGDKVVTPCDVYVSGKHVDIDGEKLMLLTVYDISELKNVQRLLNVEKENVLSCEKLKTAFIANMSHEVRTPLNAIVGFSGLLAVTSNEEEKNMYIDIINKNNDRLLQLINDILDLSQIEAGVLDFEYSEFDANDLLRELYELFKMRLREKPGVTFVCDVGLERMIIHSERQRIMQVLVNLLTNALKFTHDGEVRFGCEVAKGREVCFYVKDTGIGISAEEQKNIFSRFTKLDREIPGTGLGLTLSQTIIEKLGGRIGVDSQQHEGSKIWFTLPLVS